MTAPPVELAFSRDEEGQDLDGLLSFLQEEERKADDDSLNSERAVANDFYNGEPFGDEEDGRSQVVTRDVAEVIDYMVVSILRTMLSGDNAVEFECAEKPQQVEPGPDGMPAPKPPSIAQQATAAVGQEFYQGQNGYTVLHDWIKAALLEKSSICKACVEEQPPVRREAVVSDLDLVAMQEEGKHLIASRPLDPEETQWAVAWAEEQPPIFRDYVVPNEEASFAFDARDLDKGCAYIRFAMLKSVSDIAEMGYDVGGIGDDTYDASNSELSDSRDGPSRTTWASGNDRSGPNRTVWLLEEYARYDLNGDGITELLKVHRVGSTILNAEEIDEQPGVAWCPFPMPHRIVGQSLADKVMDIQRSRSVLMRQALDNIYQSNAPRWTINENSIGETTIDDLLTVRSGAIIRHVGQVPPMPVAIPFTAESSFNFMEVLAGERESRTGITRLNQGLDADALNKTASGTAMMQAQGQQIEDYCARNFVEAFARLMLKKYRLMKKYGRPMTVSIDGEYHEIDPRTWPDSMSVRVRVGLGTGRKTERLAARMNLLQITQLAMEGGSRVFDDEKIYNQVAKIIEDSSLGPVSEFANDPATLPPEEEQPDPETLKVQAQAQIEAAKVDQQAKQAEAENALKAQQQQIDAALKQQQNDYDLAAKREKDALDQQLARQKAEFEANLALRQQNFEMEMAARQQEFNEKIGAQKAEAEGKRYRDGGDLDK